jgi:hypothetical protein
MRDPDWTLFSKWYITCCIYHIIMGCIAFHILWLFRVIGVHLTIKYGIVLDCLSLVPVPFNFAADHL